MSLCCRRARCLRAACALTDESAGDPGVTFSGRSASGSHSSLGQIGAWHLVQHSRQARLRIPTTRRVDPRVALVEIRLDYRVALRHDFQRSLSVALIHAVSVLPGGGTGNGALVEPGEWSADRWPDRTRRCCRRPAV